jgi:hypothetical protein
MATINMDAFTPRQLRSGSADDVNELHAGSILMLIGGAGSSFRASA